MAHDPYIGRSLGNVRLIEKLGQGAMGVVYRGYHLGFRKEVAVKLLLAHAQEKAASYLERFLREGQAAAKVHQDNVVQVIDAGQADGVAYLVMELVDGPSLGRILDSKTQLPPEAVIRLGIGICRGLAAIHAAGVIHRDIKPDNILVGSNAQPKITDLGLAKNYEDEDVTRLTATGVVVGTPLYVSPEAIRDPRTVTVAADIYSLGATFYHMVSGSPPFAQGTAYEVMRGHLEGRLRPLREIDERIPSGLADLIERCLAKEPAKRPTASELADLLHAHGRARAGAPTGLALFIALVVVAVLGAAAAGFVLIGRGGPRPAPAVEPAQVTLLCDAPRLRARVDGGEWRAVDGALALPPGLHQLTVEADQPGPTLQWSGSVDAASGAVRDVPVALGPVAVPPARVAFPGSGMLFRDGVAFGLDAQVTFTKAGVYALTRWADDGWWSGAVVIDARGAQPTSPAQAATPSRAAFWRVADERGKPTTPHHVACWWEIERARVRAGLPQPIGWRDQGQRPEQPATQLTAALVGAALEQVSAFARLPDRGEAVRLGGELHASLWCGDGARIDVSGQASAAQVVLVPLRK
ncbi:MAG TPA: serine/threonine-protein kinase [Planctomycetota bacterium]|nr:serine/threonine-protein kinase [Planctomycetota bacterium]